MLGQKVACDPGESVAFEGGFAIHLRTHFARLTGIDEDDIVQKSNNAELYFEEDDLDAFLGRLRGMEFMRCVHGMVEQPWGHGRSGSTIPICTSSRSVNPWQAP